MNQMGFLIDDLKVCLYIFFVSEYYNSPPQLFECEKHTCSRGNALWFDVSTCETISNNWRRINNI